MTQSSGLRTAFPPRFNARVYRRRGSRKQVLPPQLPPGIRRLAIKRMGQIDWSDTTSEILLMEDVHSLKLCLHRFDPCLRQHRSAILAPFSFVHGDFKALEIDTLNPQANRFHQPDVGMERYLRSLPMTSNHHIKIAHFRSLGRRYRGASYVSR